MDKSIEKTNSENKAQIFSNIKKYIINMPSKVKIKIIVCVAILAILFVLYQNFIGVSDFDTDKTITTSSSKYSYYVSSIDYCKEVEEKLKKVLSNLDSVGNIEVMVTLDSSMELVFAESNKNSNSSSIFDTTINDDAKESVSSPIIIDANGKEEPLIIKEILPKIKGVLVVCSGTNNVSSKLDIMYAVQSLLGIDLNNIQVLFNS